MMIGTIPDPTAVLTGLLGGLLACVVVVVALAVWGASRWGALRSTAWIVWAVMMPLSVPAYVLVSGVYTCRWDGWWVAPAQVGVAWAAGTLVVILCVPSRCGVGASAISGIAAGVLALVTPGALTALAAPVMWAVAAGSVVVKEGTPSWLIGLPSWKCVRCGYDLRGSRSAVCPECGTPLACKEGTA